MAGRNRPNVTNIEDRVLVLEQESAVIHGVIDKLDTTISKLTEAISSLKEIIVNQENRIKVTEDNQAAIRQSISSTSTDAKDREKEFKESVNTQLEEQDTRIKFLERWLWIVTGGGVAASWIISHIKFDVRIGQ